jgi:hypothetical protein
MRPPSARTLLETWEGGAAEPPYRRALRLLRAACPETDPEALARVGVGRRDEMLLRLRRLLFGPRLVCVAECPACDDRIELDVTIDVLLAAAPGDEAAEHAFRQGGLTIAFRQPTTVDLEALAAAGRDADGREFLLWRCIVAAHDGESPLSLEELSPAALASLEEEMAARAALADAYLGAHCQSCGHRWEAAFDAGEFLWAELDAWARRLLNEVHQLASAYGWSEDDVLRLSPLRRQAYLQMARP